MNTSNILISAIFLALFILPFALSRINRAKREKALLGALRQWAQQQSGQITQHELCGDSAIGLDETKNVAFFYQSGNPQEVMQSVDLSKMESCKVEKQTRTIKHGADTAVVMERIALRFVPRSGNTSAAAFVLFDEKVNTQIGEELQLADKWAALLNARMNAK